MFWIYQSTQKVSAATPPSVQNHLPLIDDEDEEEDEEDDGNALAIFFSASILFSIFTRRCLVSASPPCCTALKSSSLSIFRLGLGLELESGLEVRS
jgi:hypothetical protein